MLKSMRKNTRYYSVILVVIIASFVLWGVGTAPDESEKLYVATVEDYKISFDEYWRAYQRVFDSYREVYKEKFDEEMVKKLRLKEMVLNELIEDRVLDIAAGDMGIKVSDFELEEAIIKNPAFQQNGVFRRERYLRILASSRIPVSVYEESVRSGLAVSRLRNLIASTIELLPQELAGVEGERELVESLTEGILNDKRERAIKTFAEGLKLRMRVTVSSELII